MITAFLRHRGELLLLKRGDVGTNPGLWGAVSDHVGDAPADSLENVRSMIHEKVGIDPAEMRIACQGDMITINEGDATLRIRPFLFDTTTRDPRLTQDFLSYEWVPAPSIRDRDTTPGLWTAYREVAPSPTKIQDDETHGAAYLSLRALEVLRDEAAITDDWETVAAIARSLCEARPGMAVLRTRVNRVMANADRSAEAVRRRASTAIDSASDAADRAAARMASELADLGGSILTLSRSGTVRETLARVDDSVLVAESRPGGEGRTTADALVQMDRGVTLLPDTAIATVLNERNVGAVVVGADTIAADGTVVNKVGTRGMALAAARESVPCYAVATRDKIAAESPCIDKQADFTASTEVDTVAPLFDRTPSDLVTVVTEEGPCDVSTIETIAQEHTQLVSWSDETT